MQYLAVVEKESSRAWNVSFPDCPGCLTCGTTEAKAIEAAHEALEGWLETYLVTGQVPPARRAKRGHAIAVAHTFSLDEDPLGCY